MSGFRKMRAMGHKGNLPTRLAPIIKPKKHPQLQVRGKSTPENSIQSPIIAQDEFEDSFDDVSVDCGDAPAQAVIVRNARTLAQRIADETKEELARVLERVEQIYGRFELSESLYEKHKSSGNLEYVSDLVELEDVIHDQVKKKKYQKQVTVFIVGYGNMCSQRLRLLQQVSEFFTESGAMLDEEETMAISADDIDLEEVAEAIEESLDTASKLTHRLAEINREMINYMVNLNQSKTSNKSKKKLERSLEKAREELNSLNEHLSSLRQELVDKEEKIQMMFKQIETKTMEIQRYKTAAELAKSNVNALDTLRDYCMSRDDQIKQLMRELDAAKAEKGNVMKSQDQVLQELEQTKTANQEKLEELQQSLIQKDIEKDTATEELKTQHQEQLVELKSIHMEQLEQMKSDHMQEVQKLLDQGIQESLQDKSRPSTTSAKEKQSNVPGKVQVLRKVKGGDSRKSSGTDSENRRPSLCSRTKSRSNLEPVIEAEVVTDFDSEFDLDDESAWASVPPSHVFGRFAQYRRLVQEKTAKMDSDLKTAITRTVRKVRTLKAQFQDHKHRWQSEREVLLQQVEQAYELQGEAEKDADKALSHLEDFINEEEQLDAMEEKVIHEQEEAKKAKEVKKTEEGPVEEEGGIVEESDSEVLLSQTDDAKAAEVLRHDTEVLRQDTGSATDLDDNDKDPGHQTDHSLLREQHRQEIETLRTSAEERRKKSPSFLSLRSQMSFLSDAQLDEDGDMPFPPDMAGEAGRSVSFHDAGTSPMTAMPDLPNVGQSRASFSLAAHPVVQEYLGMYSAVVDFKNQISELFANKEMMSPAQVLTDIEPIEFNENDRVQPQIEVMNLSTIKILRQTLALIYAALASERDYPVSSLAGNSKLMSMSTMETSERIDAAISPNTQLTKQPSQMSTGPEHLQSQQLQQLQQLQEQHDSIQQQFTEAKQKYEVQLNHNTVMMMEMQDTITKLQHELLETASKTADTPELQQAESAIMFTRLDSERNAKVMKRAVNEQKLEYDKYKKAVSTMDTYVNLPAQRFAYLVRKYVHHRRMRMVEDNVRVRRADLDDEVYMTLGKMETLQNERARKWEEKMDELGDQRQRLASMLMQTLDSIEEESGIFLIKPMFAYKSLYNPRKFYGKPYEQYWSTHGEREELEGHAAHGQRGYAEGLRKDGAAQDTLQSTYMPPTPASGKQEAALSHPEDDSYTRRLLMGNPQDGIAGKGSHLIGNYPQPTWNPGLSQPKTLSFDAMTQNYLNTPKMLELDINRMLIAQNQISTRIASQGAPGEQVGTAGIRSYMTLKRYVGQPGVPERHTTSGVTVKRPEMMPKSMSLPPITPTLTKEAEVTFPLPPSSPPGSTPCLSSTPFTAD